MGWDGSTAIFVGGSVATSDGASVNLENLKSDERFLHNAPGTLIYFSGNPVNVVSIGEVGLFFLPRLFFPMIRSRPFKAGQHEEQLENERDTADEAASPATL